jgi:hypothetical protein
MFTRAWGLSVVVAACFLALPAWALPAVQINLSIAFNPQSPLNGDILTGIANLYEDASGNTPFGAPIDIGRLLEGDGSVTVLDTPPDPCFADGSCALYFSFAGNTGGYDTFAFDSGGIGGLSDPGTAPILRVGSLAPPDPCLGGVQPGPCRASGDLVAFDSAVSVGTWTVTMTAVPEPGSVGLFAAMLALCAALGRRRAV